MKKKDIVAAKTTQSGWRREGPPALPQRYALLFPLCVVGCYWAILIYYLGAQWSVYEQYNYGWAVPFLCLYLLWRRVAQASQPARPSSSLSAGGEGRGEVASSPSSAFRPPSSPLRLARCEGQGEVSVPAVGRPVVSSLVVLWSLALCAFLYAPTRFLHEANPIWRLTSLLWTLEVIGITLLLLPVVLGARHAARGTQRASGISALCFSDVLFPILFFLVAVPWPSGLENLVVQSLMRSNVATTVELLGFFGIPAVQHGNVIEVGTGIVGIDEACSGIRSLQATLMISLFLGELYRLTFRRRVWLVVLGFVLAFAFNVARTLLLTGIASARGVGAVASWHDPAGVTILVACFLSLWLGARVFQKAGSSRGNAETLKSETLKASGQTSAVTGIALRRNTPFSFSAFRLLSISLIAWLLLVEGGTELWYRHHEHNPASAKQWSLNTENTDQDFTKIKIPTAIAGQFRADEGIEGRWRDANGGEWQLYYFRWFPAHSLRKRVTIQLAKTHGPEKCLPAAGMHLKSDMGITRIPIGDLELAVHQYVFEAAGRTLHVFYGIYEDQGGAGALVNRRLTFANRIQSALSGSRNYGQRFLEVAVYGYDTPEEARAAFARESAKRIKLEQ